MHPFDWAVIGSALTAFGIFLILQMIFFRMAHAEAVLKTIMILFFVTSLTHMLGFFFALDTMPDLVGTLTGFQKVLLVSLSYIIYALMAFVYILCVFGPSETSIRIRVVREVFDGPNRSLSPDELSQRYNSKMILERRIKRLTRSGEISLKNGKYVLVRKNNVFFLIDSIANTMQAFIKNRQA